MGAITKHWIHFLIWLCGLILFILFFVPLLLPATFKVTRHISMGPDPELVYGMLIDFSKRSKWDPWMEREPEATIKILGHPGEPGSGWSWKGKAIGSGMITLREMIPPRRIISDLEFFKPNEKSATVTWTIADSADQTWVEWSISGLLSYPFDRLLGPFYDRMMGGDMEQGLLNLNQYCERVDAIPKQVRIGEIKIKETEPRMVLSIQTKTIMDQVVEVLDTSYKMILEYIRKNHSAVIGSPMVIYSNFSERTRDVTLEAVMGVADVLPSSGKITFSNLPSRPVVYTVHYGPYHTISSTYDSMLQYIARHNLNITGDAWEEYINDPASVDSDYQLQTIVYFPIK